MRPGAAGGAGGKGKPKSPEHRAAIAAALRGKPKSPEHAAKCRENRIRVIHGHAPRTGITRTYRIWCAMRARCQYPSINGYADYGGRGITVCDRWREDFRNFLADMGECPPGLSIDRVDNDGNYEPGNCRWATSLEQRRNQRR